MLADHWLQAVVALTLYSFRWAHIQRLHIQICKQSTKVIPTSMKPLRKNALTTDWVNCRHKIVTQNTIVIVMLQSMYYAYLPYSKCPNGWPRRISSVGLWFRRRNINTGVNTSSLSGFKKRVATTANNTTCISKAPYCAAADKIRQLGSASGGVTGSPPVRWVKAKSSIRQNVLSPTARTT